MSYSRQIHLSYGEAFYRLGWRHLFCTMTMQGQLIYRQFRYRLQLGHVFHHGYLRHVNRMKMDCLEYAKNERTNFLLRVSWATFFLKVCNINKMQLANIFLLILFTIEYKYRSSPQDVFGSSSHSPSVRLRVRNNNYVLVSI